jgi:hypothetical protein
MPMDSEKIDDLLKKYWNCESSLEEEQQLQEYFQKGIIAERHKDTAPLFRYFQETKKKSLNDVSFDAQVLNKVQKPGAAKVIKLMQNSMRIAAGISVLLMATWFVHTELKNTNTQEELDTFNDPQLAFEETKKALMMISKSFGRAEEETKKINLFNEAAQEIQNKGNETSL